MKHISTLALALTLGAVSMQALQYPVRMTFNGSGLYLPPQISLGANTGQATDVSWSGDGSLGPFTHREVSAGSAMPTGPGCSGSNSLAFAFAAGAGFYRFNDGSLLTYKIKEGTSCIDFTAGSANATVTHEITGGTGRFKNASGTLSVTTSSSYPLLFDATGQQPVLIAFPSGQVTGTVTVPDPQ
jgi:hypothetical protein